MRPTYHILLYRTSNDICTTAAEGNLAHHTRVRRDSGRVDDRAIGKQQVSMDNALYFPLTPFALR